MTITDTGDDGDMMLAVRVKEFAAVEGKPETRKHPSDRSNHNSHRRRPSPQFRPRKPPLPLASVLALEKVPKPKKNHHQQQQHQSQVSPIVTIEVYYAGIQYPDALQAQGLYQAKPALPYIPGMDCSGIVRAVENQPNNNITITSPLSSFRPGDRVMATMLNDGGTGACAQYIKVPVDQVWKLPDNVPLSTAANIGRNYFAAYHSLKTIGKLHEQQQQQQPPLVLIDGASGGVGMACVELSKAMGAKVIAAVSTTNKAQYPEAVGADKVLCYGRNKASFKLFRKQVASTCREMGYPTGVDLVVDMVHGDLFRHALTSIVKPLDGKLVLVGFAAGQKPIMPGIVLVKELNIVGSIWGPRWATQFPQQHRTNVQEILDFMASGHVRPRVDRVFPLEQFARAFEVFFEKGGDGRGNTVIEFQKEERRAKLDKKQPKRQYARTNTGITLQSMKNGLLAWDSCLYAASSPSKT